MSITLAQICDAIESALDDATTITRSQSFDELTEGIGSADTPLLQVYPEACGPVSLGSETDKLTLGGSPPHRREQYTIHADYYARQRSHIAEDMEALVDGIDAMTDVLEDQGCPPFDLDGISSFQWSWRRVVFPYAGAEYMGARFTIVLETG
jgi:hypothetical protein